MGNAISDKYQDVDKEFVTQTFSTESEIDDIMKHYQHFDERHDHRFKNVWLYKSHNNIVISRVQHQFNSFNAFNDYFDMYCVRGRINAKHLIRIHHMYTEIQQDMRDSKYIINLFIEYPYNDLKNEITFRKLNGTKFSEADIIKMLKAGIEALYRFKAAGYEYNFVIDQHSVCLFDRSHANKLHVKILEFNIKAYARTTQKANGSKLDDPFINNAKYLAITILEAGLMINEMMIYKNITNFRLYRLFDIFQNQYGDPDLIKIVDGFLHSNLTVEDAYKFINRKKAESQRFVFRNNTIVTNEKMSKHQNMVDNGGSR